MTKNRKNVVIFGQIRQIWTKFEEIKFSYLENGRGDGLQKVLGEGVGGGNCG